MAKAKKGKKPEINITVHITVQSEGDRRRLQRLLDGERFDKPLEAAARRDELKAEGRLVRLSHIKLKDGIVSVVQDLGPREDHPRKVHNPVPEPIPGICRTAEDGTVVDWHTGEPWPVQPA